MELIYLIKLKFLYIIEFGIRMIKNVSSIFSQYIECIIDTYKNETQVSRIPPLNYLN